MNDFVLIDENNLVAIGDAIRAKTGTSSLYKPSIEMAAAIRTISTPADGTIPTKSAADVEVFKSTFTIPSGYYSINTTKALSQMGVIHAPTLSSGSIINHQITFTPSVSFEEGYIFNGSSSGLPIVISANLLTSGTYDISSNGTYNIANYVNANVSVDLPTVGYNFYDTILKRARPEDIASMASLSITFRGGELSIAANSLVTNIPASTFYVCPKLTAISFPNVTTVSYYAFMSCIALESVYLPKVTYVGDYAFNGCSLLSSINLPVCTSIGRECFVGCYSLSTVSLPSCISLASGTFARCGVVNLNLPKVTSIPNDCFFSNTSIETVTAPEVLATSQYAFRGCVNLKTVSFPKLSSCADYTFSENYQLEELHFPECSFFGIIGISCYMSLRSVYLPKCTTIKAGFQSCSQLEYFYAPSLQSITSGNFLAYCSKLTSISLPNLSFISGAYIFSDCFGLTKIELPALTSLSGTYVFNNCSNLSEVRLPRVSALNNYCFGQASSLSKVYIGTNLSTVVSMSSSAAFTWTKITSSTGSIYVPTSLVTAYKTATGWSYFSNRIFGI